jgi:DNA-binding transcriptional MerR regulator
MNFTRLEQIKAQHPTHSTRAELAKVLGVHPQTIKRWRKEGRIPEPAQRGTNGWHLWSPQQVQRMIKERTSRGES